MQPHCRTRRFLFNFWSNEKSLQSFLNPADGERRAGSGARTSASPTKTTGWMSHSVFPQRTPLFSFSGHSFSGRAVAIEQPAAVIADGLQDVSPKPVKEVRRKSRTENSRVPRLGENGSR